MAGPKWISVDSELSRAVLRLDSFRAPVLRIDLVERVYGHERWIGEVRELLRRAEPQGRPAQQPGQRVAILCTSANGIGPEKVVETPAPRGARFQDRQACGSGWLLLKALSPKRSGISSSS